VHKYYTIQFSSDQKIIRTIDDKYYSNRSRLLAIYKVYSMSKLYAIMCANYALLIKTLIVNHVGLCKHFSYTELRPNSTSRTRQKTSWKPQVATKVRVCTEQVGN